MEVIARRSGVLPAPLETLRIGKSLGRGGFAVVRAGTLRQSDGASFPVAVKILHPEYSSDSCPELRLFKEEAQLMLQMDHQNIITAYGLLKLPPQFPGLEGHALPVYALILELMEGGSLASLMVKQILAGVTPKYTFSQALGWVIDVARALQYLHKGGKDGFPRIHRDVKLENVLLTAGMRTAKLADFGLQRAIFIQQEEKQQPILVRRSQRPSSGVPLPLPRGGPAGPSRLASDADRPSSRQSGPALQQSRSVQHNFSRNSIENSFLVPASPRGSSVERPRQPSLAAIPTVTAEDAAGGGGGGSADPLFYAVEANGLVPLALPKSPQQSIIISPQQQAILAQASDALADHVRVTDAAHRFACVPILDHGTTGVSYHRASAAAGMQQQQPGCEGGSERLEKPGSGQLLASSSAASGASGGVAQGPSRTSLALSITPPLSERPVAAGSRQAALPPRTPPGVPGCSSIAVRPSPLGPAPALRPPHLYLPSRQASTNDGSISPQSAVEEAPRTPELPSGADRTVSISERGPMGQSDGPTPASPMVRQLETAPGTPGCDAQVTLLTAKDWPSRGGGGGARGSTGTGNVDCVANPSTASVRDIVLNEAENARAPSPPPPPSGVPSVFASTSQPAMCGGASTHRLAVSAVPGAAVLVSSGRSSAPAAATPSRCRMQALGTTDLSSVEKDCLVSPTEQRGTTPPGTLPLPPPAPLQQQQEQLLPGSANQAPTLVAPTTAKVSFAADIVSSSPASTPLTGTETGFTTDPSGRDDGNGNGTGAEATARAWIKHPPADAAAAVKGVSFKTEAQAFSKVESGAGEEGAAASAPLQLADLLHMRLGALQVSVRSVRTSASGMARMAGVAASMPSSPRLAAPGGLGSEALASAAKGDCGNSADVGMASGVARRRSRAGSVPGLLGGLDKGAKGGGGAGKAPVADFEEVFTLTGRTGSLMYLAPEAYKNEPYNDKVDVYSLAILMYELFGRTSITYTHISTKLPAFSRMLCNPDEYAERVAAGYRPPRTNQMAKMPPALWELIEAGWHQDPVQRPDIDTLVEELEELVEPLAESEATSGGGRGQVLGHACGCVIC